MTLFRATTALMALAYLAMAGLQLNDPDPLRWVVVYAGAALACGLSLLGRPSQALSGLWAAGAVLWALFLAVRIFVQPLPPGSLLDDEEVRELGGLLIVALGMLGLLAEARQRRPGAAPSPT